MARPPVRAQVQHLDPTLGHLCLEVLLELGYDWDQIIPLKERGVIP